MKRARLKMLKPRIGMVTTQRVKTLTTTPGATPRERGRRLMARREAWFNEHPLCVMCSTEGRVGAAVIFDHVVPLWKGGADDDTNVQGLCQEHSDAKTAAEAKERAGYR